MTRKKPAYEAEPFHQAKNISEMNTIFSLGTGISK
jgi:hypothetical protein